jgi:hypothetical protein
MIRSDHCLEGPPARRFESRARYDTCLLEVAAAEPPPAAIASTPHSSDSRHAAMLYDFPALSAKAVIRVGHVSSSSLDHPGAEHRRR